jgi:hypothetical protein
MEGSYRVGRARNNSKKPSIPSRTPINVRDPLLLVMSVDLLVLLMTMSE